MNKINNNEEPLEAEFNFDKDLISDILMKAKKANNQLVTDVVDEPTSTDKELVAQAKISKKAFYETIHKHNPDKKSPINTKKKKNKRKIANASKRVNRKK